MPISNLDRRTFLRRAGQSALLIATGVTAGCGGDADPLLPPNVLPSPTVSPAASPAVISRSPFEVRYLFPLNAASRAMRRNETRAANVGGVQGVRLGKINNRGDVAAILLDADPSRATAGIYRDGVVIPAGVPVNSTGTSTNYPLDLNDNGQLLVTRIESLFRLFLWENGSVQRIELPYPEHEYFFNGGINNAAHLVGQVAGPVSDERGNLLFVEQKAYLWRGGQLHVFGPQASTANDINDAGQILGSTYDDRTYNSRLVLWQDLETVTDLNFLQSGGSTSNVVLNQEGAVLATLRVTSDTNNTTHLWTPTQPNGATGTAVEVAGLPPGFISADMNLRRDFVGTAYGSNGVQRAFRMQGGAATAEDLNSLIPANSGWVLEEAYGINDAGLITGSGYRVNASGGHEAAAFLLTPSGA